MKEAAVAFNVVPVVPFVGPFSWVAIGAIVSLMLGVWWEKMGLNDNEKARGGFKACDMYGLSDSGRRVGEEIFWWEDLVEKKGCQNRSWMSRKRNPGDRLLGPF